MGAVSLWICCIMIHDSHVDRWSHASYGPSTGSFVMPCVLYVQVLLPLVTNGHRGHPSLLASPPKSSFGGKLPCFHVLSVGLVASQGPMERPSSPKPSLKPPMTLVAAGQQYSASESSHMMIPVARLMRKACREHGSICRDLLAHTALSTHPAVTHLRIP